MVVGTSGNAGERSGIAIASAVIFAGSTVAISVVGLATIGLDFITKMGIGASLTVLTSVAVAVTLLPAVLALLGHRVDRLKIPFIRTPDDSLEAAQRTAVARWGRFVTSHAWVFLVAALGLMLLFASPVIGIQLGAADAGTSPKDTTQRVAYDWLAEGFGPGFNGPARGLDAPAGGGAPDQIGAHRGRQQAQDRAAEQDGTKRTHGGKTHRKGSYQRISALP